MEDEGELDIVGDHRILSQLTDLSGEFMGVQEVEIAPGDRDSVADVLHLKTLVGLDPNDGDGRLLLLRDVANLKKEFPQ